MVKTKNKTKRSFPWIFIVAIILVVAFFAVKENWGGIRDSLTPIEPEPAISDIVLYKFDSLKGNGTTNVEIWVLNIGDEPATNILLHVRTRNNTGGILYDDYINLSSYALRANETCTGDYTLKTSDKTYNTIEVSWNFGRNVYSKET